LDYLEGLKKETQSESSSSFSSTPCLSSDASRGPVKSLHLNHADHEGTIKALQIETAEMIMKRKQEWQDIEFDLANIPDEDND
jgi:hypothetical protein